MAVRPFTLHVPDATLADLRERLGRTRWLDELDGPGWDDGASPAFMRELLEWWRTGFDWRAQEAAINGYPHFRATVDGVGLHFLHLRGRGPAPLPLLLTHGWPSSFFELLPLVPLLTDPAGHGGEEADAFDVVIPSLPGRGSSRRIPGLWVRLMTEVLGYPNFAAHGGDIGAYVTNRLGVEFPGQVLGIHVTMAAEPYVGEGAAPLSAAERAFLRERVAVKEAGGGYNHIQRTRPQTLAYGLADSPVGLAAWILDKWWAWSDCGGDLERRFTKDQLLTTVTLYWATQTIGSSLRVYRDWALGMEDRPETWRVRQRDWAPAGVEPRPLDRGEQIRVPAAVALFDYQAPREWVERAYSDLRRFGQMPRGGHFAAMEEPELLAEDLRAFFRYLR